MSDTTIDRKRARSTARAAQALAGVLLFTGVGAAMVLPRADSGAAPSDPLAGIDAAAAELAERRRLEAESNEAPADLPPDFEGIAVRLAEAGFEPPPPPPPPKDKPDEGPVEGPDNRVDPPPGPVESAVRYLGRIGVGANGVALVSVNGVQAFIAEGNTKVVGPNVDARVEVRVVTVGEDEVEIEEDGVSRTVSRAERQTSLVSVASKQAESAPDAEPRRGRVANTSRSTGARNPLDREQFRRDDGTIDYEALRQAARERRDEMEAERIRQASQRSGEDN